VVFCLACVMWGEKPRLENAAVSAFLAAGRAPPSLPAYYSRVDTLRGVLLCNEPKISEPSHKQFLTQHWESDTTFALIKPKKRKIFSELFVLKFHFHRIRHF